MSTKNRPDDPTNCFSALSFGAKSSDKPVAVTATSTPTSNPTPSPQPLTTSSSGASTHSSSAYTQTDKGIDYMDEGEKDKNGNVITATKEPL
ncbi:hypothetical protein G6011_04236 [Alternaria panax]|uniref:Uncharacterized protein n=1 Tax=Alternaria panax TaxID=48097 RepID=A0AAD4IG53_9PLEO|nr:hypothetical protein G6011_04236 [Alternaria panax]